MRILDLHTAYFICSAWLAAWTGAYAIILLIVFSTGFRFKDIEAQWEKCVVKGECPAADSKFHVLLERWNWTMLQRFGYVIIVANLIVGFATAGIWGPPLIFYQVLTGKRLF